MAEHLAVSTKQINQAAAKLFGYVKCRLHCSTSSPDTLSSAVPGFALTDTKERFRNRQLQNVDRSLDKTTAGLWDLCRAGVVEAQLSSEVDIKKAHRCN